MTEQDYYKLLQLQTSATLDDIKVAYRKQARRYHPDISKERNAEEKFKQVKQAYEVLSNSEKRAEYDHQRKKKKTWHQSSKKTQRPNTRSGANWNANDRDPNFFDDLVKEEKEKQKSSGFYNIFDGLFKSRKKNKREKHYHSGYSQAKPSNGTFYKKSPPQIADIALDLEDIYQGSTKLIRMPDGKNLQVKIPQGIKDGQKIRIARPQEQELYLRVNLKPHTVFTVEGKDLYLKLSIAPWESVLGTIASVPTLDGSINLTIPEHSHHGKKFRLRQRGLPGQPSGDLYIILKVVTPPAKNAKEQALYQKMANEFNWKPRVEEQI